MLKLILLLQMANSYFQFKKFIIHQDACAMKVTTDSCLFGSMAGSLINGSIVKNVLDIGAGSGLLSLMIAQQFPGALIDAIEIDEAAAIQAEKNILASPWKDQIQVIHTDIKNHKSEKKYDLVISNPPFYENELKSPDNRRNIAHHQTHLLPAELVYTISKNISSTGKFFLLLPFKKKEEWLVLLNNAGLQTEQIVFVKQTANHPSFFRMIIQGSVGNGLEAIRESGITIKDEDNQYTDAFKLLLKDFYLHL